MKLLKRISVLVMMIAVVAAFAGCGKETSVVGTWKVMIIHILSIPMEREHSR